MHYTVLILCVIHQVIIPYSIDSHAQIWYLRGGGNAKGEKRPVGLCHRDQDGWVGKQGMYIS